MNHVSHSIKKTGLLGTWTVCLFLTAAFAAPAMGANLEVAGMPGYVMGYVNQGVQFGIAGDHYDTVQGFQAAIFQLLVETQVNPDPNLRLFGSAYVNVNWAYPILQDSDRWNEREFEQSRDNLFLLDDWETLLKEAHVTWTPGNFLFRVGKQLVKWGEMDGQRLMDQINPQDIRRGFTDVEFETTIIPIPLLRAEYYPKVYFKGLQDLGFELIFNPNVQHIPAKKFLTGNEVHGIWAPNSPAGDWLFVNEHLFLPVALLDTFPPGLGNFLSGRFPVVQSRVGAMTITLDKPDNFDPDYFECGLRLKTVIYDTTITLNGFYGREDDPVVRSGGADTHFRLASDGLMILEPAVEGYYPLLKFVGFTMARDFEDLTIQALGGVAPILRIEALYAFNSTFATSGTVSLADALAGTKSEQYVKHDEIRYGIGIDWKVRLRWLNPRDGFGLSFQFMHHHILDYPSVGGLNAVGPVPMVENNYLMNLMVRTTYFHNKIIPMIYWQRGIKGAQQADLVIASVVYDRSYRWNYTLQFAFAEGSGMASMDHKDNISFTVAYRF